MSWLNQHTQLVGPLEVRRRTEWARQRLGRRLAYAVGAVAVLAAVAAFATVVSVGGSHPGRHVPNPFVLPKQSPGDQGPLSNLVAGHPAAARPAAPSPGVSPPAGTSAPEAPTASAIRHADPTQAPAAP